jgi:ABC-type transport system involved in multi-copper enzyme maturation permease subunit
MTNLLKVEWLKIKAYPAFWWVLVITAISYPAVNYTMSIAYHHFLDDPKMAALKLMIGNPFAFNEVWHTVAYFSSWFVLFPAIIVIMLITNEYTFKTYRQNVIDGWSRNQFLLAKLLNVFVISIIITGLYLVVCLLIGMKNTTASDKAGPSGTYFIAYFFLQTFSQLSIAFIIGFFSRKSFIALSVFLFLFLILEPILTKMFEIKDIAVGHFLPFEISDRMIPPPAFFGRMDPAAYDLAMKNASHHFLYTLVFTMFVWIGCFRFNRMKDL